MAWTAPMTAVANEIWEAAEFNTYVRDNLNACEVATVTAAGQYVLANGLNSLVARTAGSGTVTTSATTTSTTYTATLSTGATGPAATVTTGTRALVHVAANCQQTSDSQQTFVSYAVSGATTIAASDTFSFRQGGIPNGNTNRGGRWVLQTGLTAGSNTFTTQYRVTASTGTFADRHIIVVPL